MNDNRKPTTTMPITMVVRLGPYFDSTVSAMRRSSPVAVMADAISTLLPPVPRHRWQSPKAPGSAPRAGAHVRPIGLGHAGRIGQQNTISAAITTAFAEYSSALVIHTITANAKMG